MRHGELVLMDSSYWVASQGVLKLLFREHGVEYAMIRKSTEEYAEQWRAVFLQ